MRDEGESRLSAVVSCSLRLVYRAALVAAKCWWFVRRPDTRGSLVALWLEGRVLLVRTSYRPLLTLPGGFVKQGESSQDAGARELWEELRVVVPAGRLRLARQSAIPFEHRNDVVTVWDVTLDEAPLVHVDNRELVWAGWMTPSEALAVPLLPHVRAYLSERATGS